MINALFLGARKFLLIFCNIVDTNRAGAGVLNHTFDDEMLCVRIRMETPSSCGLLIKYHLERFSQFGHKQGPLGYYERFTGYSEGNFEHSYPCISPGQVQVGYELSETRTDASSDEAKDQIPREFIFAWHGSMIGPF
jgi:hypothetical protein